MKCNYCKADAVSMITINETLSIPVCPYDLKSYDFSLHGATYVLESIKEWIKKRR